MTLQDKMDALVAEHDGADILGCLASAFAPRPVEGLWSSPSPFEEAFIKFVDNYEEENSDEDHDGE